MIVTGSWLKDFVDYNYAPTELSHRLTMAGLEVDNLELLGEGLDAVIVARLLAVEAHPDADKLTLCRVATGSEEVQVVCGATNHRSGDLVALAQVGAVLPGDFKIKKSKIRGCVSMGMLCSEKELGLADNAAGIMILPAGLTLGEPVFSALGIKDARYELGLTPNRADCLSVLGVAREVAAMTGGKLKPLVLDLAEEGAPVFAQTSVTIEAAEDCPRYAARLIRGVKIGPSPAWLAQRIESVGMRSINNVVDVTNYILMELGQPLHAFDFMHLRDQRIVVKHARDGELFTTLDGQERKLLASDLVICDGAGPVALAGIMGGLNSEVKDVTTDILLESAYFNPLTVRRTSKRLGIHSESSHRFERGTDVANLLVALDRATQLIVATAGGTVARGAIDVYPQVIPSREIPLRLAKITQVLGEELPAGQVCEMLESLGLTLVSDGPERYLVTVPHFRHDLEREIDLIEEVVRLNGYDNIPLSMPNGRADCQLLPRSRKLANLTRDHFVAAGYSELINYSFVSPASWDQVQLPADDPRRATVNVLNPLTDEQSVMRTSLVPSVLQSVAGNLAYRTLDLRLFELRPVFHPHHGAELPTEQLRLCAALCGRREPQGWANGDADVDFYDLKGVLENLLATLHINDVTWQGDASDVFLHPGKSCTLRSGESVLGTLGEVHPRVLANFDIDTPVIILDLNMAALISRTGDHPGFKPVSRFPVLQRDTALLVADILPAADILKVVAKSRIRDIEDVVIFDLYCGKGIPAGKKSVAIRVSYRSVEKTLTDDEINAAHGKLVNKLCQQLEAEIR
ncbi:MAG: phenylalanine--tRNA ligase subunit beta [Desulfuromonadales bacterium]|nr:phenylalanine--tRNA ligase subunit beta [Desulfuromonadales bacterium]MDT8422326.1 phenylalanine--tRNA ligase subunit beta [Desulfuromonadales bacterium]